MCYYKQLRSKLTLVSYQPSPQVHHAFSFPQFYSFYYIIKKVTNISRFLIIDPRWVFSARPRFVLPFMADPATPRIIVIYSF